MRLLVHCIEGENQVEFRLTCKHGIIHSFKHDNHILRAHEPAMEVVLERIREFSG